MRGFADKELPAVFFTNPVSRAADISAFNAKTAAGSAVIESTEEIAEKLNMIHGERKSGKLQC